VQVVISGLLIGLVFSLVAIGLTLIWGVMDIVNFAHGEFLMLAMYAAFWLYALFGIDPIPSLPINIFVLSLVGIVTYLLLIRRILRAPMVAQIFATFGLTIFLRGLAQFLWTPNYRTVQHPLVEGSLAFHGVALGLPQLAAGAGSLIATGALMWFINRTETGMALLAVAEDRTAAALMGIDAERIYILAWAISAGCVAIAGGLLALFFSIYPEVGAVFGLIAFVTVALGGFGSISGAFVAGILIGLVLTISGFLIDPAFKYAIVYAFYLVVVLIRPQGLFGARA
jgi:branched-chain amino acid transport system permease protein